MQIKQAALLNSARQ